MLNHGNSLLLDTGDAASICILQRLGGRRCRPHFAAVLKYRSGKKSRRVTRYSFGRSPSIFVLHAMVQSLLGREVLRRRVCRVDVREKGETATAQHDNWRTFPVTPAVFHG